MAKIKTLEKFKGELNGTYQTLWVATSEKGNYFTTSDLELKQVGDQIVNDIKATKWKSITNEEHSRINDEMHSVEKQDYQKSKAQPKHSVSSQTAWRKRNKGMSI